VGIGVGGGELPVWMVRYKSKFVSGVGVKINDALKILVKGVKRSPS